MHQRRRLAATLIGLLALWLQMLAPALALEPRRHAFDPLASICHGTTTERPDGDHKRVPHAPSCDHCVLCHAVASGVPDDGRPAFTRLDYPVVGPLRWRAARVLPGNAVDLRRIARPRGPPTSA